MKKTMMLPLVFSLLAACATVSDYSGTQVNLPLQTLEQGFRQAGADSEGVPTVNAREVVVSWWETLNDPELTRLVETALENNRDIASARSNVAAARALLDNAELGYLPHTSSRVGATEQRLAEAVIAPGLPERSTVYEAGFDVSWELGLFGRTASRIDLAESELGVSQATLDGVYVSTAAEVARAYIQLRGAQHRLDVNRRNADNLEQSHKLTLQLMDQGLGNALDVQRSLTQWELVRAVIPVLQAEIDMHINRLGVLTGQLPGSLRDSLATPQPLPSIPLSLNAGDPISLLQRRPDVRRQENLLKSAIARYDLSVAELYPDVSITGSIGFLATHFADLGSGGTLTHLINPGISWQAFNLGRVQNSIDADDARVQAQLASFEQTLLTSFEEVDNAMTQLRREAERRSRLQSAANASASSSGFARQRFEAGSDSFLDVLLAQRTQLDTEDQLVVSEVSMALQLVSLYKALGGGWQLQQ